MLNINGMRQWNSIDISDIIGRQYHCCLEIYSHLEERVRISLQDEERTFLSGKTAMSKGTE